jgi:hypothetical protein
MHSTHTLLHCRYKIARTADFAEAAADPTFVGDPDKEMPITLYKPHGC